MRKILCSVGVVSMVALSAFGVEGCNNKGASPASFKEFMGFEFNKPTPSSWKYKDSSMGGCWTSVDIKRRDFPEAERVFLDQFEDFVYARAMILTNNHELTKLSLRFGDGEGLDLGKYNDSPSEKLRYKNRAAEIAAAFEKKLGVKFEHQEGKDYWGIGNEDNGASVDISFAEFPSASSPIGLSLGPSINVDVWDCKRKNRLERKEREEYEAKVWKTFGLIPFVAKGKRASSLEGVFGYKFGNKVDGDERNNSGSIVKLVKLDTYVESFSEVVLFGMPEDGKLYGVRAVRSGYGVDRDAFTNTVAFVNSVFGEPKKFGKYSDNASWEIVAKIDATNTMDRIDVILSFKEDDKLLMLDFKHKDLALKASIQEMMQPDRTFGIIPESMKGMAPSRIKGAMGFEFGCDVGEYKYERTSQALVASFRRAGSAAKSTLDGYEQIKLFGSKSSGECFMVRVCFDCDSSREAKAKVKELKSQLKDALGMSMEFDDEGDCQGKVSNIIVTIDREDSVVMMDFVDVPRYRKCQRDD